MIITSKFLLKGTLQVFFPLLDGKVKNSLLLYFSVFLVYLCLNAGFFFYHIFHFVFHRFCQGDSKFFYSILPWLFQALVEVIFIRLSSKIIICIPLSVRPSVYFYINSINGRSDFYLFEKLYIDLLVISVYFQ